MAAVHQELAVRITFDGWLTEKKAGATRVPVFVLWRGDQYLFAVEVRLPLSLAEGLLSNKYKDEAERRRLERVLLRFALHRIESDLTGGSVVTQPDSATQGMVVQEEDRCELAAMLADKTCDYQIKQRRDLFCTAAARNDGMAMTEFAGYHRVAPTSRRICKGCDLPDTDDICSHLVHPSVATVGAVGPPIERFVASALCDRGRYEIEQGGHVECHAGGHSCWERLVEPVEAPAQPVLSPLSLLEQIDFLDSTWRHLFGEPLLNVATTAHVGGLALGCRNKEEFTARLTDLAAVLDSLRVPGRLLPPGEEAPRRGALKKVEAALRHASDDPEAEARISGAVSTLRLLVDVRAGYQHSDAKKRLPGNFATLGIPYPPTDWEKTWNQIRARGVDALAALRDEIRQVELARMAPE